MMAEGDDLKYARNWIKTETKSCPCSIIYDIQNGKGRDPPAPPPPTPVQMPNNMGMANHTTVWRCSH